MATQLLYIRDDAIVSRRNLFLLHSLALGLLLQHERSSFVGPPASRRLKESFSINVHTHTYIRYIHNKWICGGLKRNAPPSPTTRPVDRTTGPRADDDPKRRRTYKGGGGGEETGLGRRFRSCSSSCLVTRIHTHSWQPSGKTDRYANQYPCVCRLG